MCLSVNMIRRITGEIVEKGPGKLVVQTGGLGYAVHVPATLAAGIREGDSVVLFTHHLIREQSQALIGFADSDSLSFFEILLSVSGVGPKGALHLMALGTVSEIQSAIARQDVTFLCSVSGIGKKTAERIVVELRDVMQKQTGAVSGGTPAMQEVAEALASLGYKTPEIQKAINNLHASVQDGSTEALLKEALQFIQTL